MGRKRVFVGLIVGFAVLLVAAGILYRVLSDRTEVSPAAAASSERPAGETVSAAPAKQPAADFPVLDADGNEVRLSDHLGTPVVINFWASWCGPCRSEFPAFESAYQAYGDRVQFLMVNLTDGFRETKESASAWMTDNGYTLPILFDTTGQAASVYRVYSIPMTIAVDAEGNLVSSHIGAMTHSGVETLVQTLLS